MFYNARNFVTLTLLSSFALTAKATYSIVATDNTTKKVGGAGATCLPGRDIYEALYRSEPGKAVLHTQGLLLAGDDPIVVKAYELMKNGVLSSEDVLGAMVDMDDSTFYDRSGGSYATADLRQYGIADFASTAAYSGTRLGDMWSYYGQEDSEIADLGGNVQTLDGGNETMATQYLYHAMGNVVKVGTVTALETGFRSMDDTYNFGLCDIAGRLMTAMYQVANEGLGDERCLDDFGTSSSGAYIHIDNEDGTDFIHINEVGDGTVEAVEVLKDSFDEWRRKNPCSSCTVMKIPPFIAVLVTSMMILYM